VDIARFAGNDPSGLASAFVEPGKGLMRKLSPMFVVVALVVSMMHGVVPTERD
jgi:hypothetical protein